MWEWREWERERESGRGREREFPVMKLVSRLSADLCQMKGFSNESARICVWLCLLITLSRERRKLKLVLHCAVHTAAFLRKRSWETVEFFRYAAHIRSAWTKWIEFHHPPGSMRSLRTLWNRVVLLRVGTSVNVKRGFSSLAVCDGQRFIRTESKEDLGTKRIFYLPCNTRNCRNFTDGPGHGTC